MNYENIYIELVNSRKLLNRRKSKEQYFEIHHILPTSLGGTNDKSNLVLLTAREHFIAHLLLTKFKTGKDRSKMIYALWRLTNGQSSSRKPTYSSRQYEQARHIFIQMKKEQVYSPELKAKFALIQKDRWSKISIEDKKIFGDKVSKSKAGIESSLKGKTYEEIYKENPSKRNERIEKVSKKLKGKTLVELHGEEKAAEIREKYRKAQTGKKHSEKSKEIRSEKLKKSYKDGTRKPKAKRKNTVSGWI